MKKIFWLIAFISSVEKVQRTTGIHLIMDNSEKMIDPDVAQKIIEHPAVPR